LSSIEKYDENGGKTTRKARKVWSASLKGWGKGKEGRKRHAKRQEEEVREKH